MRKPRQRTQTRIPDPVCNDTRSCFARMDGKCTILTDVYSNLKCPFCKTEEQFRVDAEKYKGMQ